VELPYTGSAQSSMERRAAWRSMGTRQAGSSHPLTPLKPQGTGERRCVDWRRGALGAAIHCRRPKLRDSGAVAEAKRSLPTAPHASLSPRHISSHRHISFERCTAFPHPAPSVTTSVFSRSLFLHPQTMGVDPEFDCFIRVAGSGGCGCYHRCEFRGISRGSTTSVIYPCRTSRWMRPTT
jgi:hypothetical protein